MDARPAAGRAGEDRACTPAACRKPQPRRGEGRTAGIDADAAPSGRSPPAITRRPRSAPQHQPPTPPRRCRPEPPASWPPVRKPGRSRVSGPSPPHQLPLRWGTCTAGSLRQTDYSISWSQRTSNGRPRNTRRGCVPQLRCRVRAARRHRFGGQLPTASKARPAHRGTLPRTPAWGGTYGGGASISGPRSGQSSGRRCCCCCAPPPVPPPRTKRRGEQGAPVHRSGELAALLLIAGGLRPEEAASGRRRRGVT